MSERDRDFPFFESEAKRERESGGVRINNIV